MAFYERFVTPELTEKPIVFEIFTHSTDESNALRVIKTLDSSGYTVLKGAGLNLKKEIKHLLGKTITTNKK